MTQFETPRKFDIFRATLPVGEREILILSADEANVLRKVVLFCELFPSSESLSLDAPTNILIPPTESELAQGRIAHMANVYTLPKNNLLALLGHVRSRNVRNQINTGLELLFGLRSWVD